MYADLALPGTGRRWGSWHRNALVSVSNEWTQSHTIHLQSSKARTRHYLEVTCQWEESKPAPGWTFWANPPSVRNLGPCGSRRRCRHWRNGSVIKDAYCSYKGLEFGSQHPSSQLHVTAVQGALAPSFGPLRHCTHAQRHPSPHII